MVPQKKWTEFLLQFLLWGLFLSLPYFTIPHNSPEINKQLLIVRDVQPYWDYYMFFNSFSFNVFLIVFFYVHNLFIFDRFILTRRILEYILYGVIVILSFGIVFSLSFLVRNFLLHKFSLYERPLEVRDIIRFALWFFLVLFAAIGVKLNELWRSAEKRAREIENEHLRTELSFLHMQINPHFLFNSLNTIYGMSLKKSDVAPNAVLKLSQLLRYMIEETGHDSVSLEQEVNYINNYIELQKMRSTSSLNITFDVQGDIHTSSIAPMLLLPFIENAFKYGISSTSHSPIDISLSARRDMILFSVINKKFDQQNKHSTGIGIPNVQRRLDLIYPGKHELDIQDLGDTYYIKLKIILS
jgi:sensor histidine kinase YesM